jgi:hypothetical protein
MEKKIENLFFAIYLVLAAFLIFLFVIAERGLNPINYNYSHLAIIGFFITQLIASFFRKKHPFVFYFVVLFYLLTLDALLLYFVLQK